MHTLRQMSNSFQERVDNIEQMMQRAGPIASSKMASRLAQMKEIVSIINGAIWEINERAELRNQLRLDSAICNGSSFCPEPRI